MSTLHQGIAVAGSVIVDKINEISAYPESGQLTQIRSISQAIGGCVPNVALDLKKIEPQLPVWAVGLIGEDAEGQFVIDSLNAGGVDTSELKTYPDKTSFTDVMSVSGGQRTFFCYAGANAHFGLESIDFQVITPKILHLGYFLLLQKVDDGDGLKILQKAKELGIETSIDLVSENSDRYALVLPCLPYVDYLIINELEAGKLTGLDPVGENLEKMGEALLKLGVQKKVIIHMPEQSICCSKQGCTRLGSYILPDGYIQGTTGAGDAFCAGALIGIYFEKNDIELLEFASGCSIMALRKADATSGLTEKAEIIQHCRQFHRRTL